MLIRISYLLLIVTVAIAAFLLIRLSREGDDASAAFTGSDRCATCHSSVPSGRQFVLWKQSAHADAYGALQSDSARAWLARHGDSLSVCIGCHTTLGRAPVVEGEHDLVNEGVGCERCHGPGSRYAYFNIMRDRARFASNGGVVGSLEDCYGCHAADPATDARHCPFQKAPFDADTAWVRIRHPINQLAPRPDTVTDLRPR